MAGTLVLLVVAMVTLTQAQDFGFEDDDHLDNRIHVMGNRPDRFRFLSRWRSRDCDEPAVARRERNASVIFTGTVRRVHGYKAQVEVKRVLKGDIEHLPGVYPHSNDIYSPWASHIVVVTGLGNPDICNAVVRAGDTRIFLTEPDRDHELRLNSSLVRLTLDNIREIESAVEGSKFTPAPTQAPTDPCERVFCAFGGRCMVDPATSTGRCHCIEACTALFSPVCGSDGTTYSSECNLRRASCNDQKRITVTYQGSCNDNVKDPCATMRCSYGAECKASYDGLSARCLCPERCDNYGDADEAVAVCGSDGRDYDNTCEMRREACGQMREINVKYHGKCDPCNGHQCDLYHVCQLDAKRRPSCRCPDHCPPKLEPVCGTDGKTYSSECHLTVEACRTRRKITVHHPRDCRVGPNPCASLRCGLGEECHVDRSGEARCLCPPSCPPVQRPVCGSDGLTYDNECELHRQACVTKATVNVTSYGRCNVNNPCTDYRCYHGALCVVEANRAVCQCPTCGQEYAPVCGTDGHTYTNECELRATACLGQKHVTVAKTGPCQNVCSNHKCENYAVCEDDGYGRPRCVCSTYCQQIDKAVCGTDGVTYANECEMKVASCQRQQLIVIASEGHCDRCHGVRCKFGSRCESGRCVCPSTCTLDYDPVCGSNGRTYDNECRMMMEACSLQMELGVEYSGECDDGHTSGSGEFTDDEQECNEANCRFGGICEFEISGRTTCNCDFNCKAIRSVVCGSDGNTYGNACQLREHACRLQQDIRQVDGAYCPDIADETLCDGATPALDTSGTEYTCTKADQCPANTYCHVLDNKQGGRCCQQDEQPIRSCHETEHGCCPDGVTSAPGPDNKGCPSVCVCNPLGSQGLTCDPTTAQCACKPGVGGLRCDRCEPGYWGLPLIANGNSGCIPCNCNLYGSVRDDCEQMEGSCVCKQNIKGKHCDRCPNGQILGPNGCSEVLEVPTTTQVMALRELETGGNRYARSCEEMVCTYGAECQLSRGRPVCRCPECPEASSRRASYRVCGSDGNTYSSECEVRRFSCRQQRRIHMVYKGECRDETTPRTPNKPRKTTREISHHITNSDSLPATPSTPEYGWLGDMCSLDADCITSGSYCRNGLCACRNGLMPNDKKTACQDLLNTMLGDAGQTYTVPSFSGINSYIQLHKVSRAYREITIQLTFKALSLDGILLYAASNPQGRGDYVSLAIYNGYVEFRYDLGSGHVVLRSQNPVTLNKFHKVKARRFTQEGVLYLDDVLQTNGTSPGALTNLDLKTDTYLGWVPHANKDVYENIGTGMPFSGCMESLSITSGGDMQHVYNLAPGSDDVVTAQNVGECGTNICSSMPCLNGGSCMSSGPDSFNCKCPGGYSGLKCEKSSAAGNEGADPCVDQSYCHNGGSCYQSERYGGFQYCRCPQGVSGARCEISATPRVDDIQTPLFHGDSLLQIPIDINPAHSLTFEVWFLALKPDGVLLYSAQKRDARKSYPGDFITLNLVNGYLQYMYNLGSGVANITSVSRLPLNVWHKVTVSRRMMDGEMTINDEAPVTGTSQGALRILNIPKALWLGGYSGDYNSLSGVTTGFTGAIQRLYVDGSQVDQLVQISTSQSHISAYAGPPCAPNHNPCLNGGRCIPQLNDFTCGCTDKFTGKRCQLLRSAEDTERPVSFDGVTNQEYDNGITSKILSQPTNHYALHFRTRAPSGLLLLQHKSYTVEGDYLTLALRDGHVEASYNLGKEAAGRPLVIRSTVDVNDGEWHTATFRRDRRKAELTVDDEDTIISLATDGATQLDTDGRLWIGGSYTPPRGLPKDYMRGFQGCIDAVTVDDKPLDLAKDRKDAGPTQYCDAL